VDLSGICGGFSPSQLVLGEKGSRFTVVLDGPAHLANTLADPEVQTHEPGPGQAGDITQSGEKWVGNARAPQRPHRATAM
jgi:hypothetical protein